MPANTLFQRFYRKYNISLKLFVLICLLLGLIIFLNSYFRIKTITVKGSDITVYGIDQYKKLNIFLLNEEQVAKNIKKQNSFIDSITVEKHLPSSIDINIIMLQPIAIVKGNLKYLLISADGRILKKINTKSDQFPLITYHQIINENIYNTGEYIDFNDFKAGLYYLKQLKEMGLNIDSVDISSFDMVVCKMKDKEIIFSVVKDKEEQIYNAGEIIKKFKIEGRDYNKIDVRFEKAVVAF